MKKISSALLLVLVLSSANANATIKEHLSRNKGKYIGGGIALGTVTVAAAAAAYDHYKNNDQVINAAAEWVEANKKLTAEIAVGIVLASGFGYDISRGDKSYARKGYNNSVKGVTSAAGYAKNKTVNGYKTTTDAIKGLFTKKTVGKKDGEEKEDNRDLDQVLADDLDQALSKQL